MTHAVSSSVNSQAEHRYAFRKRSRQTSSSDVADSAIGQYKKAMNHAGQAVDKKVWAKTEEVEEGLKHTFSNGAVVMDYSNDFSRFIQLAPVEYLAEGLDTDHFMRGIEGRGYSVHRIFTNEEAQNIYERLNAEYRDLLNESSAAFKKANRDVDFNTVKLTELPRSVYSGTAGSGKVNGNGFTYTSATWAVRSKVIDTFQKIYRDVSGEKKRLMSSGQFVLAWGERLVNSLNACESKPRAFAHIDYYGAHHKKITLEQPGVQSIVLISPPDSGSVEGEEQTTATVVFPRSHHYYSEINARKGDYHKPAKGGIPWELLVDMVNEGKIDPPVRVGFDQGCALSWSRQLVHTPHSTATGSRVAMPITVLPVEKITEENRLRNVTLFLTLNPTGGVEAEGDIRTLSLYNRRRSPIHDQIGWVKPPGVSEEYFKQVGKRIGKHWSEVGLNDLRKNFTKEEIFSYIVGEEQKKVLGL